MAGNSNILLLAAVGAGIYWWLTRKQGAQPAYMSDSARRAGVDRSQVRQVSSEAVNWPDASLGCSKGGAGAAVVTPGYRIILLAGNRRYEYHTSAQGGWCFYGDLTIPNAPM